MKLDMFKTGKGTEHKINSTTKNCETLVDQAYRKAEETLEFELAKSKECFSGNPG